MPRLSAVLGAAAAALAACGPLPAETPPLPRSHLAPVDVGDARAFAGAQNAFGLDVWRGLRHDYPGNLAISPASIATALTMTYGGARGETARAMAAAMHLGASPDAAMAAAGELVTSWNAPGQPYELSVANRLFGDKGYAFAAPYLAATRDQFGAELAAVDFRHAADAAIGQINGWVSEQTRGLIPAILPPHSLDDTTRLVLVNAVYFHGTWKVPFEKGRTADATFHAPDGDRQVPTMHRDFGAYGEDHDVKVLELPYDGDRLSMMFVLPVDDGPGSLAPVEDGLDAAAVDRWAKLASERRVDVSLPRFELETPIMPLGGILAGLGMGVAFSDSADFSAMSAPGQVPLKIDVVFHRALVELDEDGTKAAAATAVGMVEVTSLRTDPPPPPPTFKADHPFLFFLRDTRSGAILFAGRVADPS
jgi:serine protease inhibitor